MYELWVFRMTELEKAEKPLIGPNQSWHSEKEYDCHMCDYHKKGIIKEVYPNSKLTSIWVCPHCYCGRENRLGEGIR